VQVTLHNSALMHMDTDPGGGLKKLNFLLASGQPPEAFANLLLLYCKQVGRGRALGFVLQGASRPKPALGFAL
jgi:hypothetical protein